MKKPLVIHIIILAAAMIAALVAGIGFWQSRHGSDVFVASDSLVEVRRLSDYEPALKGSFADSPVYVFDSGVEGGTAFIMGGTHPNESAGMLSCYVLMENLVLEKGRIIVLPVANLSAQSTSLPGVGYPVTYSIETGWGTKTYKVGSRLSSPLDQWPDPPVFVQYPSGINLCYEDARNLNRNYPGRDDGQVTEKIGSAIDKLIDLEKVDYAFDLHEASITYPTNNALIVPEKTADLAFLSSMMLEEEGVHINVEISSENLKGFSHQEWGRDNATDPVLIEVPTPFIDRITGPMTPSLITEGQDEFLARMSDLGFSTVEYTEDGFSLEYRCGVHLSSVSQVISVGSMMDPDTEIIASWPLFGEITQNGLGAFLHDPGACTDPDLVQAVK